MPIEKSEEAKKPSEGGDQPEPVAEAILATQQRDPDEAVVADQAIRSFITDRLGEWSEEMNAAIDSFEAWVYSHSTEQQTLFSSRGFFDFMGDSLEGHLNALTGGGASPIMGALVGEIHNTVSFAQSSEFEIGRFLNECRRGVRDACWYVRDNSASILSDQWANLLDLAYEGSIDYVPRLFSLGLPTRHFQPAEFSSKLVANAEGYQRQWEPLKEQTADQTSDQAKQSEIEAETQQIAMSDELKQQAMPAAM